MNRRATLGLCAVMWVAAAACMNFDDAHDRCVQSGRCGSDDGGSPDSGTAPVDGGSKDDGGEQSHQDAGTDAGQDAGSDAGCTPAPITSNCAQPWCEVYAAPAGQSLAGIYGFSPTDVWVAGAAGFAAHWDGCGWTEHTLEGAPYIWGIWGSEPSIVWFVGEKKVNDKPYLAVRRFNPNGFFSRHEPSAEGALYSVSGSSGNDVWMVGARTGAINSVVVHWDGSSLDYFSQFDLPGTIPQLFDVWSTGADEAWIAGSFGEIWRWTNGTWQTFTATGAHFTVWSPDQASAWVAGTNGHILHGDGGTAWQPFASGTPDDLSRLRGVDATRAWAVGANGTIAELNGTTWTAARHPPYSYFNNLWVGSASEVWIVTDDGKVLHNKR